MNDKVKHNYYVKNADLMKEIWYLLDTGVITEQLGEYIIQIVDGLSKKPNFYSYTYKEEMKSDAQVAIIKGLHNFDPHKYEYPNPFSYITMIAWNAFVNVINKEKRKSNTLSKLYDKKEEILKEVDRESPTIDYEKYANKKE